jgi:hypothetical protein
MLAAYITQIRIHFLGIQYYYHPYIWFTFETASKKIKKLCVAVSEHGQGDFTLIRYDSGLHMLGSVNK